MFQGADVEGLQGIAAKCEQGGDTADQVIAFLTALVIALKAASWFTGGASAAYAAYLESVVIPWLKKVSMALHLFAKVLGAHADAQTRASAGESVDWSSLPTYQTPQLPSGDCRAYPVIPPYGTQPQVAGTDGSTAGVSPGAGSPGAAVPSTPGALPSGTGALPSATSTSGTTLPDGDVYGGTANGSLPTTTGGSAGSFGGFGGGASGGAGAGGSWGDPAGGPGALPTNGGSGSAAYDPSGSGAGISGVDGVSGGAGSGSGGSYGTDTGSISQTSMDPLGADGNNNGAYAGAGAAAALGLGGAGAAAALRGQGQGDGYTSPDGFDYNRIKGVKDNPNVTPEFLRKVEGIAGRLGTKPEYLMAAMSFESGETFSPSVKNPNSSATGLIQFMSATAKGLGTSTADLKAMTPVQQLDYVEKYFEPYKGKVSTLEGVYTSILSGKAHSDPDTVLFKTGTEAYRVNSGLDADNDGRITAAEATAKVRAKITN